FRGGAGIPRLPIIALLSKIKSSSSTNHVSDAQSTTAFFIKICQKETQAEARCRVCKSVRHLALISN
ncbi:MAG: hypothetical protein ACR2RE_16445, partial [Geminicoccaceae bacterium]